MSEPTTEELLAQLEGRGVDQTPTLTGFSTVQAWAREHKVEHGLTLSIEATDLYRHYKAWCNEQGHKPYYYAAFFYQLKKKFLLHKQRVSGGRTRWLYVMRRAPAEYFIQWLEQHPTPIGEKLPHSRKSHVEMALEELGVEP